MRKFRCPWCGVESFTRISHKVFLQSRIDLKRQVYTKCPECGKTCGIYHFKETAHYRIKNRWVDVLDNLFALWILLLSVVIIFIIIYKKFSFIGLSIFLGFLPLIIINTLKHYWYTDLVCLDEGYKTIDLPHHAEASFELFVRTPYFRDGAVLALKFNTHITKFKNTLFPVFIEDLNTNLSNDQIFGKVSFVGGIKPPREILFENAKFIVIDNGQEISKGKIQSLIIKIE